MTVKVWFFGDLRKHLRGDDPLVLELEAATTVADLLEVLGIPPDEEAIVGINGELASLSTVIGHGDELSLFSPMAGGSVNSIDST